MFKKKTGVGLNRETEPLGLASVMALLRPEMRRAFTAAYQAYEKAGVPFAVAGALAAGAYSKPRNTKDIDFLVGDEAFVKAGPLISFAFAFPLESAGVPIDTIPLPLNQRRHDQLRAAVENPHIDTTMGTPVRILPAVALAYMKLASPRSKDIGDIVAMVEAGSVDLDALSTMIGDDDVELLTRFVKVVAEIESEDS